MLPLARLSPRLSERNTRLRRQRWFGCSLLVGRSPRSIESEVGALGQQTPTDPIRRKQRPLLPELECEEHCRNVFAARACELRPWGRTKAREPPQKERQK